MGDLLTAVPALRALARHYPADQRSGAGVYVAAERWLHDLVGLIPGVRGALEVHGLTPVRPPRAPVVVNLHGSGPQSHRALLALKPTRLVAYRHPQVWPNGPAWCPDENERARWCRLLRWAGMPAEPAHVGIERPAIPAATAGAVVLHLGAGSPERRWPPERFAQIAAAVRDHPVVLTGYGDTDQRAARAVRRATGLDPTADLTGQLDVVGLAALVAAARLVVSGDTGVAHLAAAYGVPSVTIFGPASPRRWGPPARPRHRVLQARIAQPPAAAVPVAAVMRHVDQLLHPQVVP
jgi:ADP-heptose:LPS heptosyltransferase